MIFKNIFHQNIFKFYNDFNAKNWKKRTDSSSDKVNWKNQANWKTPRRFFISSTVCPIFKVQTFLSQNEKPSNCFWRNETQFHLIKFSNFCEEFFYLKLPRKSYHSVQPKQSPQVYQNVPISPQFLVLSTIGEQLKMENNEKASPYSFAPLISCSTTTTTTDQEVVDKNTIQYPFTKYSRLCWTQPKQIVLIFVRRKNVLRAYQELF